MVVHLIAVALGFFQRLGLLIVFLEVVDRLVENLFTHPIDEPN
jgi:hypothetical protein